MRQFNDSFVEVVQSEFNEILKYYGFELKEINRDGAFDNCQIIYTSQHKIISINRDRGRLIIFYGINYRGEFYLWPLDNLVRYLLEQKGENINNDGKLFLTTDELFSEPGKFDGFDLDCKRYKLMVESYLKDVIDYINADDFDEVKQRMNAFNKIVGDRYLDELKWREKGDQQK